MPDNVEIITQTSMFEDVFLKENSSIKMSLEVINKHTARIALILNGDGVLIGTITDGDVRRGILSGVGVDESVVKIMKTTPRTVSSSASRKEILRIMKEKKLFQVPVVDENMRPVRMELFQELLAPRKQDNIVVLMAGGLGTRLGSMTENCPKPMLKIGGKPILETIISRFAEQGFYKIYISVNYLADQIKEHFGDGSQFGIEEFIAHSEEVQEHFGDGSKFGIEIKYLMEDKPLGTAGALRLLPETPDKPIIVMNGDIITSVQFTDMLEFHKKHKSKATLGVREYNFQIPYGVTKVDGEKIVSIQEKPAEKILINAGIYVLEPDMLSLIPKKVNATMPQLFDTAREKKHLTCAFPIRESWIDIGRIEDFVKASTK